MFLYDALIKYYDSRNCNKWGCFYVKCICIFCNSGTEINKYIIYCCVSPDSGGQVDSDSDPSRSPTEPQAPNVAVNKRLESGQSHTVDVFSSFGAKKNQSI